MTMHSTRLAACSLLCVAAPLLSGCVTVDKVAAGAVLPLAAVADTVAVPFQALGRSSRALMVMGDAHSADVIREDAGEPGYTDGDDEFDQLSLLDLDLLTSAVYYVPAYLLYPFDAATPNEWYTLTHDCLAEISAQPGRAASGRRVQ